MAEGRRGGENGVEGVGQHGPVLVGATRGIQPELSGPSDPKEVGDVANRGEILLNGLAVEQITRDEMEFGMGDGRDIVRPPCDAVDFPAGGGEKGFGQLFSDQTGDSEYDSDEFAIGI